MNNSGYNIKRTRTYRNKITNTKIITESDDESEQEINNCKTKQDNNIDSDLELESDNDSNNVEQKSNYNLLNTIKPTSKSLDKEQIKQVMKDEGWYIGKEELSESGFVDEFIDAEENPEDISMARKAFANSIERFKENAKENNAKPNFEAVAKVIENINNLATMPSDNEKIVNSNLGANMEFSQENFNELLNANKVLSANRETMSNRYETLSAKLETVQAALDTTKEENVALKASMDSKLSDAETAVREALSLNITNVDTVVKMMNATPEEATKLALMEKEDSSINQGDSFEAPKDAWADFIK
jgi:hypothetical protein